MENFELEFKMITEKFSLPQISLPGIHLNQNPFKSSDSIQYFKQLSKMQQHTLYEIFREDFEMFDYSPQPYI